MCVVCHVCVGEVNYSMQNRGATERPNGKIELTHKDNKDRNLEKKN